MQKQYDQAIASYQKVPDGDTNSDKAKIEIGMTQLEKGDLAAAETTLMGVAQGTSANKEVFYNLGEVKFAKGETDEAAKWLPARRRHRPELGQAAVQDGSRQAAEGRHGRRARDHEQGGRGGPELRRSGAGQGVDRAAQEVAQRGLREQGSGFGAGIKPPKPKPQAPRL